MQNKKMRLDLLLVEKKLADSREKAQSLIGAGLVWVNGVRCDKGGHAYPADAQIVVSAPLRYVSRGGFKLEKALLLFNIDLTGKTVLDVGASTGGFTDCALQNKAAHVTAVDVGKGQLAWKLREDPRVTVLEKTNIRYLESDKLVCRPQIATIDVSFISLRLVFPAVHSLLEASGEVVALIKPQFEAGKEAAARSQGVIKDKTIHVEVLASVLAAAKSLGWGLCGLTFSPLKGPEGNIEFLAWWKVLQPDADAFDIEAVVSEAHHVLL